MTVYYKSFFKKYITMQIPYLHSSKITRVDKIVCYLNGFQQMISPHLDFIFFPKFISRLLLNPISY